MSLATRCTACGTVFRVVQDQLKVSEGWVRCGRCKEVFNALEGLFDLEREAPPEWPAPAGSDGEQRVGEVDLALPDIEAKQETTLQAPVITLREDATPAASGAPQQAAHAAAAQDQSEDSRGFADARFETSFASVPPDAPAAAAADSAAPPADAPSAPEFVRQAEQRARWQTPRARVLLGVALLSLLAALALQVGLHFRDRLAAQWPQMRSLLVAACSIAGCRLDALRRIDDLAVESSTLTRAGANTDALRLTVALRNRGNLALAMPTFELSLTDGNGELVARRALSASDFASRVTTLAPLAEANLQLLLSLDGRRVAGYTIEVFYP